MPLSREMRRLEAKWEAGQRWPKRLEWVDIEGIRGWTGQRFDLNFPIMAVVGENGSGKSTVLQAAASVYAPGGDKQKERFASDFFPDTPWDQVRNARITYSVLNGNKRETGSIRKLTDRWRGNPERPKRYVSYVDLSRIQPVSARLGYVKIANPSFEETSSNEFGKQRLERVSAIMGRPYDAARMATVEVKSDRWVPVLSYHGQSFSGFHQGAGETTITELLNEDVPPCSLVLIDEIESSLHPRAQRRLIRDLADMCRELELQIILTTHSPYVLNELPLKARAYIMGGTLGTERAFVYGVSADFAITHMDEDPHPEIDIYVEDKAAERLLIEILATHAPDLVARCQIIPFGAASVGQALGQMVQERRFPRPSCVFLDGDRPDSPGCFLLPGDEAPEREIFEGLKAKGWGNVSMRLTNRGYATVADALTKAMTLTDHHDWVTAAASELKLDSDTLWQVMAAEWASSVLDPEDAAVVVQPVSDLLNGIDIVTERPVRRATALPLQPPPPKPVVTVSGQRTGVNPNASTTEPAKLF